MTGEIGYTSKNFKNLFVPDSYPCKSQVIRQKKKDIGAKQNTFSFDYKEWVYRSFNPWYTYSLIQYIKQKICECNVIIISC